MKCPACNGNGNKRVIKHPGGDIRDSCSTCQGYGEVYDVTGDERQHCGERMGDRYYASPYVYKTYFKKKGCFVSTTVCSVLGKDDNCEELLLLRSFRDQILLKSKEGIQLVEEYYECSPDLLTRLAKRGKTDPYIYERLYRLHLCPIIELVRLGKNVEAVEAYIIMVNSIASGELWITARAEDACRRSLETNSHANLDSANAVGRADG
jgi:hypothetical protein